MLSYLSLVERGISLENLGPPPDPPLSLHSLPSFGIDTFCSFKSPVEDDSPCGCAGQSILTACGEKDFYA